jgi:branched-chain amino acid transport system ATP-binding protein
LAGDFQVILLDEPTAGLNPQMREKVLKVIDNLRSEHKIVILIEHDMDFVRDISDWIYFMYEGEMSYFGLTDHIMNYNKIRNVYIGL